LQSSTEPETKFPVLDKFAVQKHLAFVDMYERQTCAGVIVVTQGCCQLFCRATLSQKACSLSWANQLCIALEHLQTCMKEKFAHV